MSGFGACDLGRAAKRAADAMVHLEQELNAADARLGDGDTGGMLARVIGAFDKVAVAAGSDVGAAFSLYGRAAATATGSSLGTLFATALLTLSRATKGRETIPWDELGSLLIEARDAMMARGGAKLGDKTVLDALDAVATNIDRVGDPAHVGEKAVTAGREVLDRFRQMPNRVGRARMFADATIGLDDPGMLAFVRLSEALVSKP